ncbi:hypothetical protein MNBD_GAMMA01-1749 [hydrothermal vent metagenome]|uniref:Uncharacterized protein n=1 Tax=hydrothermal vent metagenome TaxID=652676 RepID=A0A3B0VLB3_9ZZZZ
MKKILLLASFFCSFQVFSIEIAALNDADLPNPAISISYDDSKNMVAVIVNEWHDKVDTPNGRKQYKFQQGYDYTKKQGFIRSFNQAGKMLNETYSARYDGMVTREEMLIAFEIFKKQQNVIDKLKKEDGIIILHGGFNYEDKQADQPCYQGNRCVHVFASSKKTAIVSHSVIKLVDASVPYPEYDTDPVIWASANKKAEKYFK